MKITIPHVDHRSYDCATLALVDEDTGKDVGLFMFGKEMGRRVSLFDRKYEGTFESHAECFAFAKGVEAVLSHIVSINPNTTPKESA